MIDQALLYAARGWPVFRLTGFKTPLKGSHGFKDATTDGKVIRQWWPDGRGPNIGLATGARIETAHGPRWLVVIDADGAGLEELLWLARQNGVMPRTLCARTSNGWHFYFYSRVELRSQNAKRLVKGGPGIDLKGVGGYVVLPPSVNAKNGFVYQWANWDILSQDARERAGQEIAELPPWGESYWLGRTERSVNPKKEQVDSEPGKNKNIVPETRRLVGRALALQAQTELGDFIQALKCVRADCGYDQWFEIGAAIHEFDSGAGGLALFKAWSRSAPGYVEDVAAGVCERKWLEYEKGCEGKPITRATVFHLAQKERGEPGSGEGGAVPLGWGTAPVQGGHGQDGQADSTLDRSRGQAINGHELPADFMRGAARSQIHFTDVDDNHNPKRTTTNARQAIEALGVSCRHDLWHERMTIAGEPVAQWAGDLSDAVILVLREMIKREYGFDAGTQHVQDAAMQLCLQNQFDPVRDYLDSLVWDGVERIAPGHGAGAGANGKSEGHSAGGNGHGCWLASYMGADNTDINQEFGRLLLVAAVRRVRQPGSKFDQIVVLEGPEGTNKSTALRVLAGDHCFADTNILLSSDREQQEAIQGVWIYELSELQGLRRMDVERLKQFASRQEDRARPAYGRFRVDRPRRCIFVGTTNTDNYLQSATGNRRFWPVKTGRIDVERIRKDRDQLWAEASWLESKGTSIALAERFWAVAGDVQESRREAEPWTQAVIKFLGSLKADENRITKTSVGDIIHYGLNVPWAQVTQSTQTRVARILKDLEWVRFKDGVGNDRAWKYKPKDEASGSCGA